MEPQPRSNNLALSLTALGRHDEAVPLLRMTLDAREREGTQSSEWITVAGPGMGGVKNGWVGRC